MTEARLLVLVTLDMNGEANSVESEELTAWADENQENAAMLALFRDTALLENELIEFGGYNPQAGFDRWRSGRSRRGRWAVAAAVAIAMGAGIYIYKQATPSTVSRKVDEHVMTVASGQPTVTLKTCNGQNILTIPRGRDFHTVLPDGSQVWLNNGSVLRYPTSFDSNRTVELSGEGYFEIAPERNFKPFVVITGRQRLGVLATVFNIRAYPEENVVKATLLSGEVRITSPVADTVLTPGEQSRMDSTGHLIIDPHADTSEIVAWKNGNFSFTNASIEEVMNQVGRWYNVDVEFEGAPSDVKITAKINRDKPLQAILQILEKDNIHCRLAGHRLIVLANR